MAPIATPPFTLDDVPDYPARLDVALSDRSAQRIPSDRLVAGGHPAVRDRGRVHRGGGTVGWTATEHSWGDATWIGRIGLLVFVSVVVLLFRGEYPRSIFDFVLDRCGRCPPPCR